MGVIKLNTYFILKKKAFSCQPLKIIFSSLIILSLCILSFYFFKAIFSAKEETNCFHCRILDAKGGTLNDHILQGIDEL